MLKQIRVTTEEERAARLLGFLIPAKDEECPVDGFPLSYMEGIDGAVCAYCGGVFVEAGKVQ